MNIGSLAKRAKVSVQAVRYYERIGILKPILRRDSGYRVYDDESVRRLHFIKRGQGLGFTLEEIHELLALRPRSARGRRQARKKAQAKIIAIHEKIAYLRKLEATLKRLVRDCKHRTLESPCPILDRMEEAP
jgi:MerR family transcriptional regulator, copper efflux regulator